MKGRRRRRVARGPSAAEAAEIDARYGLEPVYEPGQSVPEPGAFVAITCPYCGEAFTTALDLTTGGYAAIEDCQVCCRPIEIVVHVDDDGGLARHEARRLD